MADKRMRLRAIMVSTRDALKSLPSAATRIRTASDALLAELQADTVLDGSDPGLLRDITAARSDLWNHRAAVTTPRPHAGYRHN